MKNRFHILILLAWLTCAITSCGGHADRASLVAIDSLIMHHPDSACTLLAAYPADSLANDHDRAYHALLTTIAHYKAYRPATTDSIINIAVAYYDDDATNADHRMRALLYKGCVMEQIGNIKEALHYYKEAQYACPKADHFHKGYIHYKIGCLFQSVAEVEQAVIYYKKAIAEFNLINENYYSLNCVTSIGEILRISQPDTAIYYIQKGLKQALEQQDAYHIFTGYGNLAGYYFYYNQFEKAITYASLALSNDDITLGNKDIYYVAAESYLELGKLDSAQYIFAQMPPPENAADSMIYCRTLSDIYKWKGDTAQSYILSEEADKYQCESNMSENNGLVNICNQIDNKYATGERNRIFALVITLFIVMFCILSVLLYRRIKQASQLKLRLETLNKQLVDSLSDLTSIEAGTAKTHQDIQILKSTISQYMELLKKSIPWGVALKEAKNPKMGELMDSDFFNTIFNYINIEYPHLLDTLRNTYKLKEDEIRIVALELCHFPNYVIWSSTNLTNLHSLINKKKIIAKKVNNATSILDIVNHI